MRNALKVWCVCAAAAAMMVSGRARGAAPADQYAPYTDSSETILDNYTKLTWQRNVSKDVTYTWDDAVKYCSERGPSWRLPTVAELLTLVDVQARRPSIDVKAFPNTPEDWFWSSSRRDSEGYRWTVTFFDGANSFDPVSFRRYVRCVRS